MKRVWMQPGSWDARCVREGNIGEWEWECFIYGGEGDAEMKYGSEEGWCLLVHGEEGLKGASGAEGEKGKL